MGDVKDECLSWDRRLLRTDDPQHMVRSIYPNTRLLNYGRRAGIRCMTRDASPTPTGWEFPGLTDGFRPRERSKCKCRPNEDCVSYLAISSRTSSSGLPLRALRTTVNLSLYQVHTASGEAKGPELKFTSDVVRWAILAGNAWLRFNVPASDSAQPFPCRFTPCT